MVCHFVVFRMVCESMMWYLVLLGKVCYGVVCYGMVLYSQVWFGI